MSYYLEKLCQWINIDWVYSALEGDKMFRKFY